MASIPLKPQYGPTLGRLLAPRGRAASRPARAAVTAAGVLLAMLVVAAALSLLDASYSHGGSLAFSFRYRGLYRSRPRPGAYVRVASSAGGRLRDSFEVAPLRLAPYRGSVTGQLPLLANAYAERLRLRFSDFTLRGEGKTRITPKMAGYDVRYTALLEGGRINGRDVILLPGGEHVRQAVVLEMLTREPATVAKPVANQGVLEKPLKTFSFG